VSVYLDASALLNRILHADPSWITGRHTWVEITRNLARLVEGSELARLLRAFRSDWSRVHVVELDQTTCELAADTARVHGVRTLDALHLAAAMRVGGTSLPFFTYDFRQAQAARSLGLTVLGC
jgi:predicted nucleic acid-binding protein